MTDCMQQIESYLARVGGKPPADVAVELIVESLTEIRRLRSSNEQLRRILSHVPTRVAMKAREAAGYGVTITTMDRDYL